MRNGPAHVEPLVHFWCVGAVALHGAEGCVLNAHVFLESGWKPRAHQWTPKLRGSGAYGLIWFGWVTSLVLLLGIGEPAAGILAQLDHADDGRARCQHRHRALHNACILGEEVLDQEQECFRLAPLQPKLLIDPAPSFWV